MKAEMDEAIFVDDMVRTVLAKEFGVSPTSVTRYLRGMYRPYNKRIELIRSLRERAKTLTTGLTCFIARDEAGGLNAFRYEPRKSDGCWLNPLDKKGKFEFPDILLPEGANPQYEDKLPIRLLIKIKKPRQTV